MFFGLGSDGTVGANKNSIKIIAEETDNYGQGYFVYDSKKAGAITISHLRFGPQPIRSAYLIKKANFIACHNTSFLDKYDMLASAEPGATFLLNTPVRQERGVGQTAQGSAAGDHRQEAEVLRHRRLRSGQGHRHGRAHQHHHADLLLRHLGRPAPDEAIAQIKKAIKKTYGKKGEAVVKKNYEAVDTTLAHLCTRLNCLPSASSDLRSDARHGVRRQPPEFVQERHRAMIMGGSWRSAAGQRAFPADGAFPTGGNQPVGEAQHRTGHPGVG
jgi:pyruvate-ferredoxin/flavodoxin oxidoreductase